MPSPVQPGTRFNHYEIRSFIGEGGMATVYLAQDLRHTRPVAIKLMNRSLSTSIGNERFRREIETAARLTHPHIVPLHDSGIVDDQPFYVMPFVAGESLRARLARERTLPVDEAVRLSSQVASALGYAHQNGLVHRDIKPENILLSDGIALVSDFGIARAITSENVESLTIAGTTLGTPAYMSPEQVEGMGEIDGRSDLYSLACVLFEMLAGQPPFAGSSHSLIHQHLSTAPPSINTLRPDVPVNIASAIDKGLSKAPSDRFDSAAEFVKAITSDWSSAETKMLSSRGGHEGSTAVPNNLPKERTHFIGREQEMARCLNLLETTGLLTITALGGSGKTRLAIKIGEHFCRGGFPDGIYFIDLSSLSDGTRVVDTVAQTLGVRQDADKDLTNSLITHLTDKRMLLLLDNCEHLIEACATLVDQLLNVTSELKLLATSREALGVTGENVFALRPLSVPMAATDLKTVASTDAVRLFIDRAQLVVSDFQISEGNASDIAEICRRLDGVPLAIELAAARVRVLSTSQICQKLNDRFRLLTSDGRTTLPKHQTLRAAIQWSYEQLTPEEQRILRLLSVFAGGWTLELAGRFCERGCLPNSNPERLEVSTSGNEFEILDLLTPLIDKSLIAATTASGGERRYNMLETVREFAHEQLRALQELDTARENHLLTFLDLAERAYPQRVTHEQEWCSVLETEIDNLRSALEFARTNRPEKYVELVGALAWFWQVRSHLREGREHLTSALSLTSEAPASAPANYVTAAKARALWGAAHLLSWQGDPVTAQTWMQEAIATWRELGDTGEVAFGLEGVGWAQFLNGEDAEARATFEECLRLQEAIGDAHAINRAKVGLVQSLVALSEVETARPLALDIIHFSETHNDQRSEHFGWHFLADCALIVDKCDESLGLYKKSLAVAKELGDQLETSFEVQGVAMSLAGLGLANHATSAGKNKIMQSVLLDESAKAEWYRIGADIHIRFWDTLLKRFIGAARNTLSEPELADAITKGRALPFDTAITLALQAETQNS
jgi:non-specific serine/threonine protein kinase